ncbi:hypothetical protein BK011_10355 [Tenericutes bacterium MZ-XQ]|nr:hypothetical protein BK011_10355 [Tenericutes bacterium MZ-XQ]
MKKLFSIFVLSMTLFLLVGCKDNQGEFPEINENKEVEMTAEEVTTLLSAVNMETEVEDAMMLSINIDMSVVSETTDMWTSSKVSDTSVDLLLTSTTYMYMNDDIAEVKMLSENDIDLSVITNYVDEATEDEDDHLKGSFNAYFTDQYLYYNADLETSSEVVENGKYKLNFGVTQEMWDEVFTSPEDIVDDYLDVGIDLETAIDDSEMIGVMLDADMLKVYQSGGETTVLIDITKQGILEHANDLLDVMYDTSGWTEADYQEYKMNDFEMQLDMFTELELQVAFVLKDDQMTKMGYQFNISGETEDMSIDLTGTMVFDMFVDMPKMPSDLEDYELTEFPLEMFFNSYM